jgi:hypothetical protein
MSDKDPAAPSFKERAKEEFKEVVAISIYLAFFFSAIVTYTILLLRQYGGSSLSYAFGIINALVVAKVIALGKMAHLGSSSKARPMYQTVFLKAFIYTLLVLVFHFLEEFIKRLIYHEPSGTVLHINPDQLIGRMLLVFCTFIPLFAFLELRRILGEEKFFALFFKPEGPNASPRH